MAAPVDTYTQDQITVEQTKVPGDGVQMDAHLARPKAEGRHPAVIVIHENMGIDPQNDTAGPHFQNLVQRFARQGYVAVAPSFYQRGGGPQENPGAQVQRDMRALFDWLRSQPYVKPDGIGAVGFCWGGGVAAETAVNIPELKASIICYGRSPDPIDSVAKVNAAVMGVYGGEDKRISEAVPELDAAMKKHGKQFEYKIYDGAQHAFFNERKGDRHHPQASEEAWERMLAFYGKHLK